MITSLSAASGRSNLRTQVRIHRRQLRRRFYRLRRKVRGAVRVQRESAVINYLSAKRFPPESKEALILRLLARNAMKRGKKLEIVLNHLFDNTKVRPRKWLFDCRRLYVSYAPRLWLLLWLKHHKDK
jgi:hypothetical protein